MSRGNPSPPDAALDGRHVIFEFTRIGDQTKVAAVDVETGAEAVVFGPASAANADLERLALNKLRYLIDGKPGDAPDTRPGKLV